MPSLSSRPLIICASICLAVQMIASCSLADISFEIDIVTENYTLSNILITLKTSLSIIRPYRAYIPSFNDEWGFVSASESLDLTELTPAEIDARVQARLSNKLKSYDGLTHQAMFTLPKHIRHQLAETKKIITDKEPIFTY